MVPAVVMAQERSDLQREAIRSFHGPDGTGKDGPMAQLGPNLIQLYHAYRQHQAVKDAGSFEPIPPRMPVVDKRYVVIDAVANGETRHLQDDLQALGLRQSAEAGRVVSGLLPIAALRKAADLSSLHRAAPSVAMNGSPPQELFDSGNRTSRDAGRTVKSIGETTTEGDVSLYADVARKRFGVDGSGTKTCVVSTSYDTSNETLTTAEEDIRSGDLPGVDNPNGFTEPVEVLEESLDPRNDEGRAMLQIIHDVAPGTTLGFHTAAGGIANFVQGIRELAVADCGVIVDDIFYLTQPMYQDGLIAQAIEGVTATQNVSYFTSAKNSASLSYAAPFENSGRSASSLGLSGSGTLHDFNSGTETDVRQRIKVPDGTRVLLSLQWDDPFFRISGEPGADTDLDIYLLNDDKVVASSTRDNIGGDPWEFLSYENFSGQEHTLNLAIVLEDGPEPERLKYMNFDVGPVITEYPTDSPTGFAHSDAASAVSVAAAVWTNTPRQPSGSQFTADDPPLLNGFSSLGGIPVLFDENGRRLSSPVHRSKPDLTAPDGGDNTFFGADFDDDGFPNFFGTSAAAPHAAAVAALMREVRPNLSPKQIHNRLERSAVDILQRTQIMSHSPINGRADIPDGEGDDRFSGTGLIRADRVVQPLVTARVTGLQVDGKAFGDSPNAPVHFQWQTLLERSSVGFVVERRSGPLTDQARRAKEGWQRVGFVPTKTQAGTSTDTLRYRFEGEVPTPGEYAFRLRHVTAGGPEDGHHIGAATELEVPIRGSFSVHGPQPNPSRGTPEIEVVVEQGQEVQVGLYDTLGRRIKVLYDDFLSPKTPLLLRTERKALASGTYFLQVRGKKFTETRKMIVVR